MFFQPKKESISQESTMFDMHRIGARIAQLRRTQSLTQADLAQMLGISYQAVSNWERGESMPDIGKLMELAKALNTTVDTLLGSESLEAEAPACVPKSEQTSPPEVPDESSSTMFTRIAGMISGLGGRGTININGHCVHINEDGTLDETKKTSAARSADAFPFDDDDDEDEESAARSADAFPFDDDDEDDDADDDEDDDEDDEDDNQDEGGKPSDTPSSDQSGSIDIAALVSLAPYARQEDLDALVMAREDEIDLPFFIALAPFLSQAVIDQLIDRVDTNKDPAMLSALMPYVSQQKAAELIHRVFGKNR